MTLEVLRDIGLTLLGALAVIWAIGVVTALVGIVVVIGRSLQRSGDHRALLHPRPPLRRARGPARSAFAHVLFVTVDERGSRLAPEIDVLIYVGLPRTRLVLELVDGAGTVRRRMTQPLSEHAQAARLRFEPFVPPGDATVAEVLTWRWDVLLVDAKGERARWEQRLTRGGRVDDEAELVELPTPRH